MKTISVFRCALLLLVVGALTVRAQDVKANKSLDDKVRGFLDSKAGQWHELNVPTSDGKLLYDLVLKNHYTSALEIGTSTGHSGIWIAWALSKTGGKLITIEIDESRYKQALANFAQAGLSAYIDARRADAHDMVKTLDGPFDFAFSDADKDWYKQYFLDIAPKLKVGGCFTAHNVFKPARGAQSSGLRGTREYIEYVLRLPNFETTFNSTGNGLSISYKKSQPLKK
jgi:caffeoyl-CoA O-methyltransferase